MQAGPWDPRTGSPPVRTPWPRAVLLAATVLVLAMTGAAIAAPVTVKHERSDNSLSFTYDADSGTMPVATSSERISRHDPMSFELTVTPKTGSVVGHIHLKL